jgi:hypothetical protein
LSKSGKCGANEKERGLINIAEMSLTRLAWYCIKSTDAMKSSDVTSLGLVIMGSVTGAPANKPVVHVSWFDTARFANRLLNGQGNGDAATGLYIMNGAMSGINPLFPASGPATGSFNIPRLKSKFLGTQPLGISRAVLRMHHRLAGAQQPQPAPGFL